MSTHDAKNRELFTELLRFTVAKDTIRVRENFFTAALAGVIKEDVVFARAFIRRLNANRPRLNGRSLARSIINVEPRAALSYSHNGKARRAIPDLVMSVATRGRSPLRVAVEVKLAAPTGITADGVEQLPKYLRVKTLSRVAYIRGYARSLSREIKTAKRFLRPADQRDHFIWSDFYDLLEAGANRRTVPALHRGLLGLMDAEGFRPSHKLLPDLHAAPTAARLKAARISFREHWEPTREYFQLHYGNDHGWRIRPVKSNGVMWWETSNPHVPKVEFSPYRVPGAVRIWMYLDTNKHARALAEDMGQVLLKRHPSWRGLAVRIPDNSVRPALSISVPYASLLRGLSSTKGIGAKLQLFSSVALETAFALAAKY